MSKKCLVYLDLRYTLLRLIICILSTSVRCMCACIIHGPLFHNMYQGNAEYFVQAKKRYNKHTKNGHPLLKWNCYTLKIFQIIWLPHILRVMAHISGQHLLHRLWSSGLTLYSLEWSWVCKCFRGICFLCLQGCFRHKGDGS